MDMEKFNGFGIFRYGVKNSISTIFALICPISIYSNGFASRAELKTGDLWTFINEKSDFYLQNWYEY